MSSRFQKSGLENAAASTSSLSGSKAHILLRDVTHSFGAEPILQNLSLSIAPGEFFGILGPSGSGKTTLLRVIGGFTIPQKGEVFIGGEAMGNRPPNRRSTTMVFQHLALFPT